jgi:hypothetical protein
LHSATMTLTIGAVANSSPWPASWAFSNISCDQFPSRRHGPCLTRFTVGILCVFSLASQILEDSEQTNILSQIFTNQSCNLLDPLSICPRLSLLVRLLFRSSTTLLENEGKPICCLYASSCLLSVFKALPFPSYLPWLGAAYLCTVLATLRWSKILVRTLFACLRSCTLYMQNVRPTCHANGIWMRLYILELYLCDFCLLFYMLLVPLTWYCVCRISSSSSSSYFLVHPVTSGSRPQTCTVS